MSGGRLIVGAGVGWSRREYEALGVSFGAFEAVGVQHMVAAPWQKDLDGWLRSMDLLAEILDLG